MPLPLACTLPCLVAPPDLAMPMPGQIVAALHLNQDLRQAVRAMLPGMKVLDPLVARAQAGDRAAIDALFRRHREDVTRIAYRFLGPSGDLEDVVQEAFIQLFRSLSAFQGKSKFSTWMYRVVSNVAKMHMRAARVRPALPSNDTQVAPQEVPPTEWPDDVADQHKRLRALYKHLHELSEKKRTVLVLHDFEGLSPSEIADIVEAPVLTVRTRLFYARKEIYAALAAEPTFEELRDIVTQGHAGRDSL